MTSLPVIPRALAIQDVEDALAYYLSAASESIALQFLDELKHAYTHLAHFPESGPWGRGGRTPPGRTPPGTSPPPRRSGAQQQGVHPLDEGGRVLEGRALGEHGLIQQQLGPVAE